MLDFLNRKTELNEKKLKVKSYLMSKSNKVNWVIKLYIGVIVNIVFIQ